MALTRPRIGSGVSICTREKRSTTLTASEAPRIASATSDSGKYVDNPNTMVAQPNSPTTVNIAGPTCRSIGCRESTMVMRSAPMAGAEPARPHGEDIARIDRQQRGGAAKQDDEEVEQDDAEEPRAPAHETPAGEDGGEGRRIGQRRRPRDAHAGHERDRERKEAETERAD